MMNGLPQSTKVQVTIINETDVLKPLMKIISQALWYPYTSSLILLQGLFL